MNLYFCPMASEIVSSMLSSASPAISACCKYLQHYRMLHTLQRVFHGVPWAHMPQKQVSGQRFHLFPIKVMQNQGAYSPLEERNPGSGMPTK